MLKNIFITTNNKDKTIFDLAGQKLQEYIKSIADQYHINPSK